MEDVCDQAVLVFLSDPVELDGDPVDIRGRGIDTNDPSHSGEEFMGRKECDPHPDAGIDRDEFLGIEGDSGCAQVHHVCPQSGILFLIDGEEVEDEGEFSVDGFQVARQGAVGLPDRLQTIVNSPWAWEGAQGRIRFSIEWAGGSPAFLFVDRFPPKQDRILDPYVASSFLRIISSWVHEDLM